MNTVKFIHISGDKVNVTYERSDLEGFGDGDIISLMYTHKGKLSNVGITKRNGEFEPCFPLMAHDPLAAPFVHAYAEVLDVLVNKSDKVNSSKEKVVSAKTAARTFYDWAKK